MPFRHEPWHSLARLRRRLGLVTLLLLSQACSEDPDADGSATEAGGGAPDSGGVGHVESQASCLYDEANEAVEQASAEANRTQCLTDDDCTHTSKLPSCYAGCPVLLPAAALNSFQERVAANLSCDLHDQAQCAGRAVPECAAQRAICVARRCQQIDASIPDNGCPYGCTYKLGDFCAQWELSPRAGYEATLATWTKECGGFNAAFVLEAECSNGQRLLYRGSGLSIERRYFDGAGELVSLDAASDGNPPGCPLFWPVANSCGSALVTRMVCGNSYDVGQRIQL